jgi:hypothetical protein
MADERKLGPHTIRLALVPLGAALAKAVADGKLVTRRSTARLSPSSRAVVYPGSLSRWQRSAAGRTPSDFLTLCDGLNVTGTCPGASYRGGSSSPPTFHGATQ